VDHVRLFVRTSATKFQVGLVGLLAFIYASESFACSVPPSHWSASVEEMVRSTPTIVLARATREVEDGNWRVFHFESISSLKGEAPATFSLRTVRGGQNRGDYSQHQDPLFWGREFAGNYVDPGSCTAYGQFSVNETYLVFVGGPDYPKSYEIVRSEQDFWFRVVSATVEAVQQQFRAIREIQEASTR